METRFLDAASEPIEYRRLAGGVYLPAFLRVLGWALCGTYIPLFAAEMGASKAEIGLIVGTRAAGLLAADMPAGLLVSRLGTRKSMAVGLVGMAMAFSLTAACPSLPVLAALLFAAGFCAALVSISQLTILRHAMPDRIRGRALSAVGGSIRIAGATGPLLGGFLVDAAGFRATFGCCAALLVCACMLFLVLGPRRQLAPRPEAGLQVGNLTRLVRENAGILGSAGGTLMVLSVLRASRRVLLPLWGHEMGLTPTAIGVVVSVGAWVDTLSFPLGGLISDRKGRKYSLLGCMGVFSAGLMLLAGLGQSYAGFVAAAGLIGFGNGLGAGINMTVGSDLAPPGADTGPFLGLWRVLTDTGGMIGPVAVGSLSQLFALGPAAVAIGAVGLVGTTFMWRVVPEPRGYRDRRDGQTPSPEART